MEYSDTGTNPLDKSTQAPESEQQPWRHEPVIQSQQATEPSGWQPGSAGPQTRSDATHSRPVRANSYKAWIALSVLVVLAILMAVVQAAYKSRNKGGDLPAAHPVLSPVGGGSSGPSPNELSNTFRAVAKAVKPAVVYINITETVQHGSFPQFPGFDVPGDGGGATKQQASGSGFIVKDDGYIITNYHVVGKADKIDVYLADGRKFRAQRVGSDQETDLAVIKIDANSLPTAVLGDSDSVEQGDWVLAIGSPFGLQQTITAGIISATSRQLIGGRESGVSQLDRYIQTDASINPGNSGGPLVNMSGEVVGINTLIYSPNGIGGLGSGGGNVGIGFAIPSNQAREIYGKLIKEGKVTRGYLGVFVQDLDEASAKGLGVDQHAGALIRDITDPNSPAAKAGLKSGDVITAIDGTPVKGASELTEAVVQLPVGHSAKIDYIRDGQHLSTTVELAERPPASTAKLQAPDQNNDESDMLQSSKLGISVQTVTPDVASQLKLKIPSGAIVMSVDRNGPAGQAGMGRGDVIHRIGRTEVKSGNDLAQASKSLKSGDDVMIQLERGGVLQFVTVSID